MFRRLRTKLAVLYAGLFSVALTLLSLTVYAAISTNARGVVRGDLVASGTVFDRVWALRASQLTESASLLSRDFGLQETVATHDPATIDSALENLRRRLGIDVAFIVGVDGAVSGGGRGIGAAADRVREAVAQEDNPSGVLVIRGAPYQAIAAPILSPTLAGWLVFASRLDRREMSALERLSAIPLNAAVLTRDDQGRWRDPNLGGDPAALTRLVSDRLGRARPEPVELMTPAGEALVLVKPLKSIGAAPPAALLLSYPWARALAPYEPLLAMIVLMGLGALALLLAGSFMLARSVTRPMQILDEAVQGLQRGERVSDVPVTTGDELGRLAASFNAMAAEIREREARITHLALHDTETDLPNRLALARGIEALAPRAAGRTLAVVAFNIDRFAAVRNAIGYTLSDALAGHVGRALAALRPGDPVARISNTALGLAFLAQDAEEASQVTGALQRALELPARLGNNTVDISLTAGMALFPDHGERPSPLINRADAAVDQARSRRAKLAVFDADAYGDPAAKLSLMSQMLDAIAAGEVAIHLQPKFDVALGRTTGVEALVRWRHPVTGPVPPDTFIPLAEETGHIRTLTEHVLTLAIAEQAQLLAHGHALSMSVNLSGRLLGDVAFADLALAMAAQACGPLCLEITETSVIDNPALGLELIERFAAAGLKISIDDYGSGLSSLAYLKQIRAHELKIDKAFIVGIGEGPRDALLVRSTIELAHGLGLKVTAEGVETAETQALLAQMGCDMVQGYGVGRPMPLADLIAFLDRERDASEARPVLASAGGC